MSKDKYRVYIEYRVAYCDDIEVEADTLEEAVDKAHDIATAMSHEQIEKEWGECGLSREFHTFEELSEEVE